MKIIMTISIYDEGLDRLEGAVTKEVESEIIPTLECLVEDSAWKEPKKIIEITCNFEEGYYFINFGKVKCKDQTECKKESEMYKHHNWTEV